MCMKEASHEKFQLAIALLLVVFLSNFKFVLAFLLACMAVSEARCHGKHNHKTRAYMQ